MNQKEFKALCENVLTLCDKTLISKGNEYSSDNDRLANFKKHAAHGRTSVDVLEIYAGKHQDSLSTFRGKLIGILRADITPLAKADRITQLNDHLSEALIMRVVDAINYELLGFALLQEIINNANEALREEATSNASSFDKNGDDLPAESPMVGRIVGIVSSECGAIPATVFLANTSNPGA